MLHPDVVARLRRFADADRARAALHWAQEVRRWEPGALRREARAVLAPRPVVQPMVLAGQDVEAPLPEAAQSVGPAVRASRHAAAALPWVQAAAVGQQAAVLPWEPAAARQVAEAAQVGREPLPGALQQAARLTAGPVALARAADPSAMASTCLRVRRPALAQARFARVPFAHLSTARRVARS